MIQAAVVSALITQAAAGLPSSFGCGACPGECVGGLCLASFERGASPWEASAGMPLPQLEPLRLMQDTGPVDPLRAPLEAFMRPVHDEPRPSQEMRVLQAQIEAAHATEAAIGAQNQALHKELEDWRAAGEKVVQREGRVVDLVHQLRGGQQVEAPGTTALLSQQIARAEATIEQNPGGYFLQLCALVCLCLALLYGASIKERVLALPAKQVVTCGAYGCCLRPMMQRVGVSRYEVEVSEITICLPSVPAGGDICVTVQIGRESCLRTTSAVSLAGSPVYKFRDAFCLEVGKSDGLCVLGVVDRDQSPGAGVQQLARLEITAEDLLKAAHQKGTDYFRYGLCVSSAKSVPQQDGMIDEDCDVEQRPYLAMRVRDVSGWGCHPGHFGVQRGGVHMYSSDSSPYNTFSS